MCGRSALARQLSWGKDREPARFYKLVRLTDFRVFMPACQTMAQPLTQKYIELGFLVGLVHGHVGVRVNTAKTPRMLGRNHLSHARIVVHLNLQFGYRQPRQAVFLPYPQRAV